MAFATGAVGNSQGPTRPGALDEFGHMQHNRRVRDTQRFRLELQQYNEVIHPSVYFSFVGGLEV